MFSIGIVPNSGIGKIMEDDIQELLQLWQSLEKDTEKPKTIFQLKLLELTNKYSMSKIAELTGISRPLLYYYRDRNGKE